MIFNGGAFQSSSLETLQRSRDQVAGQNEEKREGGGGGGRGYINQESEQLKLFSYQLLHSIHHGVLSICKYFYIT